MIANEGFPSPLANFRETFLVQARVIHALVLREIRTRFWKSRIGYATAIGEPLLHVVVWIAILSLIKGKGTDAIGFICMGILPFFAFKEVSGFLEGAIKASRNLSDYPLIRHIDVMFSRFLLEAATMVVVSTIIMGFFTYTGFIPLPKDLLRALAAFGSLLLLGLGFGIFNSVYTLLSPVYARVLKFSGRILYLSSGMFFTGNSLPPVALEKFAYNPAFHGVELFRSAYALDYESRFASMSYVLIWAFTLLMVGLASERVFREKLQNIQ
jgi:capsular polysaccharide transport system permease protein